MRKPDLIKLAGAIYSGAVTLRELPKAIYNYTADKLKRGVKKGVGFGFSDVKYNSPDRKLLANLTENVYKFSAAKTFQMTREMTEAMVVDDKVIPFNEFKKAVVEIANIYNGDYLRTEYNTAIASAQSASAWSRFENEKETLPNLRYSTIGDACEICLPMDGIVLPVDDPFWDSNNVPQHFNCLCLLEQEDETVALTSDKDRDQLAANLEGLKDEMFKNNVGKTEIIFNSDHPYFSVPKEFKKFAEENFGLEIPEDEN